MKQEPYISANKNLPEITIKALILSVILVILLAATNAYLGLKVGTTVSGSIPAAVISMGILGMFRRSNILENNIVQTAASAGEAIVSGIGFILPAMLIIHFWKGFNFQETLWVSLIGGILGVLFSIPVRRILLFQEELKFPEGTAIGEVLKAGAEKKQGIKYLISGSIVGGVLSFCQAGFQIISSSVEFWQKTSSGLLYGFGLGMDPAIIAAGYIVGVEVGIASLIGGFLGWIAGVPIISHIFGAPTGNPNDAAMALWDSHIRYIGVGTMLTGGFWTLIKLMKPMYEGVRNSLRLLAHARNNKGAIVPRTERDIPMNYVLWTTAVLCIPMSFLIWHYANNSAWALTLNLKIVLLLVGLLFTLIVGFILTILGAYFAGLVGSSNSPTSVLSLASVMLMSIILLGLLGTRMHFSSNPHATVVAIAFAIMIATVISAASISNETIQDLKAGYMVGATPWKQQVMLIIGVIISALLAPSILQLLFDAYGMGGVFPHPGMDPSQMLAAPQAGMMAAIAQATFSYQLPWAMLSTGAIIAVIFIVIDHFLKKRNMGLPILALGIGIYLPLDASMPFAIGGIASYFIHRTLNKKYAHDEAAKAESSQRGLTLSCGLVAGSALMGVILAIPFAIWQSTDILKIMPDRFTHVADIAGIIATALLVRWIYRVICLNKN